MIYAVFDILIMLADAATNKQTNNRAYIHICMYVLPMCQRVSDFHEVYIML